MIVVLLVIAIGCASAQVAAAPDDGPPKPSIAIVPIANYSSVGGATDLLMPILELRLRWAGFRVVPTAELRPVLRRYRIRSIGQISRRGARIIADEIGVDYLLLGSWDVARLEGNPEVGISLRVLDLNTMSIVAATSVGASGEDEAGAFGRGRIEDAGRLAEKVIAGAVNELTHLATGLTPRPSSRGCFALALIPLDNFSSTEHAGDIVTNIFLSRLFSVGYFVVEPGFVRELGLTREVVSRGGVDYGSASAILADLGACRIVTGDVEEFYSGAGDPDQTAPRVSLRLRVSSPQDGNVSVMREVLAAGDDSDGILQLGREHALTTLTVELLEAFAHELFEQNRKDILHGREPRTRPTR